MLRRICAEMSVQNATPPVWKVELLEAECVDFPEPEPVKLASC